MADQWAAWGKIFMTIFEFLPCSTCKNNAFSKNQFLSCGHFSCAQCIDSQKICNCIQIESGTSSFTQKNDENKKLIEACILIIEKIHNREKTDATSKGIPLISTNGSSNQSNLDSENCKLKKGRKNSKPNSSDQCKRIKLEKSINKEFKVPKNIDKKDPRGQTRLMRECLKQNKDNVLKLLQSGADPNIPCANGWTSLQECTDYKFYDIVKLLLEYKADINAKGFNKRTALHEAAQNNDYNMVQLLLSNGADINVLDVDDKKPFDCCTSNEVKKLLHSLDEIESEENKKKCSNTKEVLDVNDKKPFDCCTSNEVKKLLHSLDEIESEENKKKCSNTKEVLDVNDKKPFDCCTSNEVKKLLHSLDEIESEENKKKCSNTKEVLDVNDKKPFDCCTSNEVKKLLHSLDEIESEENKKKCSNTKEVLDVNDKKPFDCCTCDAVKKLLHSLDEIESEENKKKSSNTKEVLDVDDKKPFDCCTCNAVKKLLHPLDEIESEENTKKISNTKENGVATICTIESVVSLKDKGATSSKAETSLPQQYAFPNTFIVEGTPYQVIGFDDSDDSDDEINICD